MKSIPEKLRDIAGWIEEGREIEVKGGTSRWDDVGDPENCVFYTYREYRAKPVKPRTVDFTRLHVTDHNGMYIQATPEVREALKAGGIEICDF